MNYYKFHIGDYMVATAHLTPMQDLIYRRVLDLYYRIEKPLPLQLEMILRLIRLPDSEIENLKIILSEFFSENEKGFENKRCDFEIKTYKKTEKRNRENGKLGGRPVKSETCKETQWVPSGFPDETQKNPVATQTKPSH